MLDEKKLIDASTQALLDHMGVAAQFTAEDAWVNMQSRSQPSWPDDLLFKMFLAELGKLMPKSVPYVQVREAIERAMGMR
jgi:hypothetical protein